MFSFPVVIVSPGGGHEFFEGTIFKLNPDLGGAGKIASYAKLARNGWHKIDFGYLAYSLTIADGTTYVFPGVLPEGEASKRSRKQQGFFSKVDFEKFADSLLRREDQFRIKAEEDLNLLVHDLRALSSSIYYQAELAKDALNRRDFGQLRMSLESIIATQTMLGIRTDVLDFSGTLEQEKEKYRVPIYRRVDKVVRCFRAMASNYNIDIILQGSSNSSSLGPNAFEIVAYVLLDNAIKYSPKNSTISVKIFEINGSIQVMVDSIGPEIHPSERERIFDRGYRSSAARDMSRSGSGIGLYLARRIVEQFEGHIWVEVSGKPIPTSNGAARNISFFVSLPIV